MQDARQDCAGYTDIDKPGPQLWLKMLHEGVGVTDAIPADTKHGSQEEDKRIIIIIIIISSSSILPLHMQGRDTDIITLLPESESDCTKKNIATSWQLTVCHMARASGSALQR